MRRAELAFAALLVPADFGLLILAGWSAYQLRFTDLVSDLRPVVYALPFDAYLTWAAGISLLWLAIFAMSGLYDLRVRRTIRAELAKIFLACSTGVTLVIVAIFLKRELFSSRFIIITAWLLSIAYVSAGRLTLRAVRRWLYRYGIGIHRLALVGQGSAADVLASAYYREPWQGYRVVRRFAAATPETRQDLLALAQTTGLDEVLLANAGDSWDEQAALLQFCQERHLGFRYLADRFSSRAVSSRVETVAGLPVIEVRRTPLDGWGRIAKRLFDIAGAILGLLLLAIPFGLVVGPLIALDSRGSVLIRLRRLGERGRAFGMLRFRSMVANAAALKADLLPLNERGNGPLFKMRDDPRVTRVGRFIRRWSIDELPAFWNVLVGEMSLVGPRPHEPEEVAQYQPGQRAVLTIKPGITGLAQISGRGSLPFEEENRLDTFYLEHWSLGADLGILAKTVGVVLGRKGIQ